MLKKFLYLILIFQLSTIFFTIGQVPNLAYKNEIREIIGNAYLNNKLFTGIMFEMNNKNVKTLEVNYNNGLKHGTYIVRHNNGKTKVNYKYSNGKIILGTYQIYNENGVAEREEVYEYGICSYCNGDGFQSCYNCSGKGKVACRYCSNGRVRCNDCNGIGKIQKQRKCSKCYGSGGRKYGNYSGETLFVPCDKCNGNKFETINEICNSCFGHGTKTCSNCNGSAFNTCNNCNGNGKTTQSCQGCVGTGKSSEIVKRELASANRAEALEKEQQESDKPSEEQDNTQVDKDMGEIPKIYLVVEEPQSFPGGQIGITDFFKKNIHYPETAKANGIEGRVFVQFIINENGNTSDVVILKGIGGGCDEEATRIVKLMKWNPGKQRGKVVKVRMNLPLKFSLD